MASEIRVNKINNRVGLGTVTYTDTGIIVSGIVTANSFKGDGSSLTGIDATALKDSGGNVKIQAQASGAVYTGIHTFQSNVSIDGDITITSTDTGSSSGPELKLFRNSASPADADYLGQIKFAGESDTGVERNYAKITGKILDASNGTEDGIIEFAHIKAGSQTITGRFRSDSLQLLNGTNLTVDGSVSATSFTGSGANLTSLPAQATIANNADNRVITGGSGVNLNGEANFTFDNGVADITGKLRIDVSSTSGAGSGNIEGIFLRNLNETDNNAVAIFAGADDYSRAASAINFINTDHSADAGEIQFDTRDASNSYAGRVQIKSSGGLVSTKGGSIPFSDGYSAIEARAPEGTTQLTVTNTTYESGTFDNETGIWFKGNYSGNDERAKSAIIHKNTGDYGVGDLYICLDGNADNTNATVNDVKMLITKDGNVTKPGNAAFHVTGTAAGVSVNQYSTVTLPFNTETGSSGYFDVGAHYDTGNYRFTAPVAGIYFFYASMLNFPSSNSGYFTLVGAKNGSRSYSYGFTRFNSANNQTDVNFSTIVSLQANDTFEIKYEAANGSNFNYYISGGHGHFFGFLLQ